MYPAGTKISAHPVGITLGYFRDILSQGLLCPFLRARMDWHNPKVAECVRVCSMRLSGRLSVGG